MDRIIEVDEGRMQKIRGYMANSTRDCQSGTCDMQLSCITISGISINDGSVTDSVEQFFESVSATFYK